MKFKKICFDLFPWTKTITQIDIFMALKYKIHIFNI